MGPNERRPLKGSLRGRKDLLSRGEELVEVTRALTLVCVVGGEKAKSGQAVWIAIAQQCLSLAGFAATV